MCPSSENISIVMPVFNEDDGISATLEALVAAGEWHELLVVDASTDPTCRQRLSQEIKRVGLPTNTQLVTDSGIGRARQMNAGAARVTGTIILFLHADTHLPGGADAMIVRALAGGQLWGRFDVRFDTDHGWLWWVARLMNIRSHWSGMVTGDQAMFVHRHAFIESGGFANIPLMEDLEISRRLKRRAWPVRITSPIVTSGRRWHTDGPIRTILLMWLLRFGYWVGVAPETLARWYRHTRRVTTRSFPS